MRFYNSCDLIRCGVDPQPIRFKVPRGGARTGAQRGCVEGVRGGSECKKVIARRGCAEGLSAKRSLHGGVHRGGVQRGARRV